MALTVPTRLNSHLITLWQTCQRRYAIESTHRYRRQYPPKLFSTVMRSAIHNLSTGIEVASVTMRAVNQFLDIAKSPGLDVRPGTNTFTLALDFCATIRTILEYLSRLTILTLYHVDSTSTWEFLSLADESGVLHHFKFVDSITDDSVYRTVHSWSVAGDMAMSRRPMTIHMFAIGHTDHATSRRISPWCRAFKSPAIPNLVKFTKRGGVDLGPNWKPVWFADNDSNHASDWVDLMTAEDAITPLTLHRPLTELSATDIASTRGDIAMIRISVLSKNFTSPFILPMSRRSCDVPYVCPHQTACYGNANVKYLNTSGLYDILPALNSNG